MKKYQSTISLLIVAICLSILPGTNLLASDRTARSGGYSQDGQQLERMVGYIHSADYLADKVVINGKTFIMGKRMKLHSQGNTFITKSRLTRGMQVMIRYSAGNPPVIKSMTIMAD